MLPTLILLYALDTGQIPTGCYVVTWIVFIIQAIGIILKEIEKSK